MRFFKTLTGLHNYIFCRFYTSINRSDFGFLAEWRAVMLLILIEIILFFCLIIPLNLIFEVELLSKATIIVLVLLLVVKNYFMYDHNDKWKEIINAYDDLDKKTKRNYTIWYWIITLGIFPLLVFEFYVLGKIKGTI